MAVLNRSSISSIKSHGLVIWLKFSIIWNRSKIFNLFIYQVFIDFYGKSLFTAIVDLFFKKKLNKYCWEQTYCTQKQIIPIFENMLDFPMQIFFFVMCKNSTILISFDIDEFVNLTIQIKLIYFILHNTSLETSLMTKPLLIHAKCDT